jgi:membrane fusion protein (multidrug efflux system)
MCCIALVLCLSSILGCDSKEKAVQPPKAGAGPPPEVTVVELTPQTVSIYRDFVALTYSVDMVEIRARVEGFIEERLFTAGQNVKQRDVLYVLDLQPYQSAVAKARADLAQSEANLTYAKEKEQVELTEAQAQLAQAEANLAKAQQDVARLQPLVRQALAARQELDNAIVAEKTAEAEVIAKKANVAQKRLSTRTSIELAQAAVEAARAELTEAELNLDYATIRAPISGRVGETTVQVGGLVAKNSTQPLTTIVPPDPISVRFKISEVKYLNYVKTRGQRIDPNPIRLILADNTAHPYEGYIKRVLNQFDPRTGTLEVQADFPNPEGLIRPGQFARVRYKSDEKHNALLIPQRAVQKFQGMQSVLTVSLDNEVLARNVVASQ